MCHVKRLLLLIVVLNYYIEIKKYILREDSIVGIFAKASKRVSSYRCSFLFNAKGKNSHDNEKSNTYVEKKIARKKKKEKFLNALTSEEKYDIIKDIKKYCECTKKYRRLPTREVTIGNIKIGGTNKIAVQTMTSCDTRNVEECVYQIKKCKDLGADLVRLTVQGVQEVEASYRIKEKLLSENVTIPLVADIHFNPKIALMAADIFDKIRVNPGNYVDGRKKWIDKIYKTKEEFDEGKLFIKEKFIPLIEKCKRLNRAIRIGTNHGSLSSRMLSYYGDTPLGMVESAFEFADLCIENNFFNIVFSMKASNAYVMIQSYRLLVARQYQREKSNYNGEEKEKGRSLIFPLHLGVTEAGFGDNGRIKSYLGIGSLLYDGIGDTIRISLTEDPWEELTPCKKLIENLKKRIFYSDEEKSHSHMSQNQQQKNGEGNNCFDGDSSRGSIIAKVDSCWCEGGKTHVTHAQLTTHTAHTAHFANFDENFRNFNNITKRAVEKRKNVLHEDCTIGNVVTVKELEDSLQMFKDLNLDLDQNGELKKDVKTTDLIIINDFEMLTDKAKKTVEKLVEAGLHVLVRHKRESVDIIKKVKVYSRSGGILFYTNLENISNDLEDIKDHVDQKLVKGYALILNGREDVEAMEKIKILEPPPLFLLLKSNSIYEHVLVTRRVNEILHSLGMNIPYIHYADIDADTYDDILVNATLYVGTCLIDLMGDGLIINVRNDKAITKNKLNEEISSRVALNSFLTLNILQDTRIRLFKTDYIACPSCGRTLFNIQETTKKIMKLTGHLKGVKIAVMGCIVNGIGEMADAHFGYVGSAPKKIDLYYGKELVERNIPEEEACDRLIELIKKHNKWQDPS
ncbi:4-hydroxy-3-methylbut-2-en-1-yl diphosphate synthase, putative (GcpE) [Plasmodium ovale wallikeri]|uniref:4-hydroxy-3-methylbut-2-en-1-yl diphosphate synthase (ferredoxin), chloroplastic n=2 Tax=Plasmodium ovale TaxID=36330 RepID=A0A1A8YMI0_PLAOA|nr:4-hydroxy-3-methylbut-2-en-1-yl diphosphate synthase, putative (GcpE) [Plasmodium ovale wallikeri]SBT46204.1 4-hydroxy-3-methylbut-2-en-1-yl diphosphate synthase, putative (GcpE) [Plasmodium ovale wallikeri]SBT76061.1 4-hydroxy-3-methylbut-2-en-1-yl diphosphate synthase, putative [Plasmodium ovale]